jgi:predicted dehydrogenase
VTRDDEVLGLGLVGAGRFAGFLAAAAEDVPGLALRAVTDSDSAAAARLADTHSARSATGLRDLLDDSDVDVVAVATPPSSHPGVARSALSAGKHVFCEKPLATALTEARDLVGLAARSGRVLVVDHVLRYNPLLHALTVLRGELLGPVQRFSFENDASDEHLPRGHWFWDDDVSGGIFVEHGVHFFDAAHLVVGSTPLSVSAVEAHRADGTADLVSATAVHPGGVLATHTHGFSHPDRCERQHWRLDHGAAEVTVEGWIPLRAQVDAWTDDAGAELAARLPARTGELFAVPGHRLGPGASVTAVVHRDAGPAGAVGRGRTMRLPHRVRVDLVLGDEDAKPRVYRESVRAALADLVRAAHDGSPPRSGPAEALAAVAVATAARRAAAEGRHVPVGGTAELPEKRTT